MTSQLTLSSCIDGPLTHKLWDSLGMDQYIRNYPGGQNMTLTQYTRQIHAANFICGLGRHCLAGQPCAPVAKMDWLVLYSVQQWNMYMNSLYEAVQGAILMVRAAIVLAITGALLLSPFNLLGATALEGAVAAGVEGEVIAGAPVAAAAAGEAGVAAPAAAAAAAGEAGVAAPAAAVAAGEAGVAAPAVGTIKLRRRHHQENPRY
ncbi:hypothetical protein PCANC_14538 [Puccinia coronata f. sp. avenae]|uniref:Uncharacterized protein n=1 Tax=Puccinia coronata f. sp. avenae TaxID=200324 RepID=A0A2N5SQK5_9BASI|nr:hypothetical protein PCANC_14538 [Puccinia coronata f. sp. avenae]